MEIKDSMADVLFNQIMKLWIIPEIKKRHSEMLIPKPYPLMATQVLFKAEGAVAIRLNGEVKAQATVRLNRSIKKGELVFDNDITEINEIELTDQDDPNFAHITVLLINSIWHIHFDFRYNKNLSMKHIEKANDFLKTAEYCLKNNSYTPFIDNLFSAAELAVKSILLLMPDKNILKSRKHEYLHSKFNHYAKGLGIEKEQIKTFNKISDLRGKLRYLESEINLTSEEVNKYLREISGVVDIASKRCNSKVRDI